MYMYMYMYVQINPVIHVVFNCHYMNINDR